MVRITWNIPSIKFDGPSAWGYSIALFHLWLKIHETLSMSIYCNVVLWVVKMLVINHALIFPYSQIPVFIQLQQMRQKYFLGVCEGSGVRTSFDMVHLHRAFSQYSHLSGLLSLFKSKLVNHNFFKYWIALSNWRIQ